MNKFTIAVPASTANIGPGFDSAGMALNKYLNVQVIEQETWEIENHSPLLPSVATYTDHFIYKVAKQIAEKYGKMLRACKLAIYSDIPLARGLGSSASAVLAGIELANQLCSLSLTLEDKLKLATEIEGHPDNVAPVIFGGMVISAVMSHQSIHYFQLPNLDLDTVVYIPNIELSTEAARSVLPNSFSRDDATAASGISNLMIASLISGDYNLAGKMMEQDVFHEPYRAELIPNYQMIKQEAKSQGAYGTVISGAGPTMISFVPRGQGTKIASFMKEKLSDYEVDALVIDQTGLQVHQDLIK
ncbi:homoserine kinase [Virgibacillus alimentarius]|uniref:Homoserine kinase n=1 Tax=Virgibacillus alimentarius TaxID=698769 RepID=A0ABS4S9Z3_9BACI|nr:homoserine kinase [Virgibacillus alimentarius]MBP2258329.1 homoserine kinase [Virgibacillus alimentarius]